MLAMAPAQVSVDEQTEIDTAGGNALLVASAATTVAGMTAFGLAGSVPLAESTDGQAATPMAATGIARQVAAMPLAIGGAYLRSRTPAPRLDPDPRRRSTPFVIAGGTVLGLGVLTAITAGGAMLTYGLATPRHHERLSSLRVAPSLTPSLAGASLGDRF